MRYFVLAISVLLSMIGTGYGLWQVQIHFDLPQWTSIIVLVATIWVPSGWQKKLTLVYSSDARQRKVRFGGLFI